MGYGRSGLLGCRIHGRFYSRRTSARKALLDRGKLHLERYLLPIETAACMAVHTALTIRRMGAALVGNTLRKIHCAMNATTHGLPIRYQTSAPARALKSNRVKQLIADVL